MNLNRRAFSAALASTGLASLALTGTNVARAQTPTPAEGAQYTRLHPAMPGLSGGKVEVIEFFSYACPHCSAFEPTLEAWVKTLPPDVVFRRVPVPFLMNAEGFQRTYYTLETLGRIDAMQLKVFNAVHVERQRLDKPAELAALAAKNGIDGNKFLDIYNSFSVANSVNKATKLVGDYRIDSVPVLAIQGRFLTSPSLAGGLQNAVATADYLIAQSRKG